MTDSTDDIDAHARTSAAYTDEDILYRQIRQWSPQWIVSAPGHRDIAVVTERTIQQPTYALRPLDAEGGEGPEEFLDTRNDVATRVLELANGETKS